MPPSVERAYKIIAALLFLNYSVFMVGYFFFPDYNLQYKYFIRPLHILVLPGIFILWAAFWEVKNHPIFQLAILYMLYMLVSGFWSMPFEWYKFGQKSALVVYILSFIILTHFIRTWYPDGFDRMLRFSIVFAAVSAIVSLLWFYQDHPFPSARVTGIGSLTNVNEFANVYGVYALLAMAYGLKAAVPRHRAFYFSLVIIFLTFIWFGQSRTAFVSLFVALLFLVISNREQKKIKLLMLLVSTGLLLGAAFPELLEKAWIRGSGPRPLIWKQFLTDVAQAPILGQGLISQVSYHISGENFSTAHNAYLQALWSGGAIGLALFLMLLVSACRQAWRLGQEHGDFAILSILLFSAGVMFTGVDTLVDRPREQWMLFWFPLALLISYQITGSRDYQRMAR